ncbi:hypothetical protein [Methylobacterium goesingense]|uniref:Uncharacterized protein n=1 Tax=Methylobacterium goesingense TaxID=243690 RepID=A0ABV2L7W2_9HYPH|nr:hypothetical protein [Methylobacterium goesingense]GJD76087.1 hypothetical protein CFIICLFH_4337 [Methylobacterium goesingense]
MLAPAPDTFATLLWPVAEQEAPPPAPLRAPPTFLRSIMPALDLAYGLSDLSDMSNALSERLADLIAQLGADRPPVPAEPRGDAALLPLADAA